MKNKKLKRKIKLSGRVKCHGDKMSCLEKFKMGGHHPLGKKTKKGTKPNKK